MGAVGKAVHFARQQWLDPGRGMAMIEELTASGDELRFLIPRASGAGHHASTINLLKRMLDYRFHGRIRIFCPRSEAEIVEFLLPGYTKEAPELVYRGQTIRFTYDKDGEWTPPDDKALLLLCGGSEGAEAAWLERTNCRFYLQLQPWRWPTSQDALVFYPRKKPKKDPDKQRTILLRDQRTLLGSTFELCAYTEPAQARDDATWDLYGAVERFTKRVAMAKAIATSAANGAKWVMPVYGLERAGGYDITLVTLAYGMLLLRDRLHAAGRPTAPVVLPVFNRLVDRDTGEDEWPAVQAVLSGTKVAGCDLKPPFFTWANAEGRAARLRFHTADDVASLSQQLTELADGQILIVKMDRCPDEIFRYFYSVAEPVSVFEGRGTQNLALNLGRPYLSIGSGGYPGAQMSKESAYTGPIQAAADVVKGALPARFNDPQAQNFPPQVFCNGVYETLTSDLLLGYFRLLRRNYGDEKLDKLRMALRYLASVKRTDDQT
jgi:hypothetical protein